MAFTSNSPLTNIIRVDDGWLIQRGYVRQYFYDKEYGFSQNNSYVAATNFLSNYIDEKRKKFQLHRNYRVLFIDPLKKIRKNYIQITKPTGGYKLFEFEVVRNEQGDIIHSNLIHVLSEANRWFSQERQDKAQVITLRNQERMAKRKKPQSSFVKGHISTAFSDLFRGK